MALFQLQRLRSRSPERRQLLEIFTHVLYGLDGSDEALVFKCSARIYAEAPELVLRCFVDERGLIGHLNIYHVTSHLLALAKEQPSVLERNRLAIEYLKTVAPHVAGSALSASAEYNIPQRLAALYIETIAALEKEAEGEVTQVRIQETTQAIQETTQAIQETTQAIQETTQEELQATTQMTQTTQPTTQPTTQQESQAESQAATLRRELQELLRSNEQVLPEQLLAMLPAAGMQRERCVGLAGDCVADAAGEAAPARGGAATAVGRAAAAGDGLRLLRRGGRQRTRGGRGRVSDAAEGVRERRG